MLKGEKFSTPYFNLTNLNHHHLLLSSTNLKESFNPLLNHAHAASNVGGGNAKESGANVGMCGESKQSKVTRRRVHEITEKRKQEEQEFESNKKVKSEGDASESLIKEFVKKVESEQANVQNDVNFIY